MSKDSVNSDQTSCTTYDCGLVASRVVTCEGDGAFPYCEPCAAVLIRAGEVEVPGDIPPLDEGPLAGLHWKQEVERLCEQHERDLIHVRDAHEARRIAEREVERLHLVVDVHRRAMRQRDREWVDGYLAKIGLALDEVQAGSKEVQMLGDDEELAK